MQYLVKQANKDDFEKKLNKYKHLITPTNKKLEQRIE